MKYKTCISIAEKTPDKIKSKLKEFFEALGVDHEKTKEYRKKFSSILFS